MSTFPEAGKGVHAFFRFQNQQNPDQISCFIIVLKFQDVQESDSKHILLDPPEKKRWPSPSRGKSYELPPSSGASLWATINFEVAHQIEHTS